jgi:hypothetical protein
VAKKAGDNGRIDPNWPADDDHGKHPVSELVADRQGALSPYGDLTFPLPDVGYVHPVTEINK